MVKNQVKIISGTSAMDALKKVKEKYGEDALVISTKKVNNNHFEVSIMLESNNSKPPVNKLEEITNSYPSSGVKYGDKSDDGVVLDISTEAMNSSSNSTINNELFKNDDSYSVSKKGTIELPKVSSYKENDAIFEKFRSIDTLKKDVDSVKNKLSSLDDTLHSLKDLMWDMKRPDDLNVSAEFSDIYNIIKSSNIQEDHVNEIMLLTQEYVPLNIRNNKESLIKYFSEILKKMILTKDEELESNDSTKIITLLGPTGVGKTTTVAKLAARYNYFLKRKYKVGIIVLDTYRIGAVEQVMQYARMMKLSIEVAVNSSEFNSAIESMKDKDVILVDTMGISPSDESKLDSLHSSLEILKRYKNRLNTLVLAANFKYDDLYRNYKGFNELFDIDTFIFSKLDETNKFGSIFSFLYDIQKPLSYFTIGQEVPEDILVAKRDYLINILLKGFK